MKFLYLYSVVIFSLLLMAGVSVTYAQEPKFFESLYDVPVMPGLEEMPEMAMSFDKPDGRISEAGATATGVEEKSIFVFYQQSLAQMGWQEASQGVFIRNGEKLEIFIEKTGDSPLIRFLLSPL